MRHLRCDRISSVPETISNNSYSIPIVCLVRNRLTTFSQSFRFSVATFSKYECACCSWRNYVTAMKSKALNLHQTTPFTNTHTAHSAHRARTIRIARCLLNADAVEQRKRMLPFDVYLALILLYFPGIVWAVLIVRLLGK